MLIHPWQAVVRQLVLPEARLAVDLALVGGLVVGGGGAGEAAPAVEMLVAQPRVVMAHLTVERVTMAMVEAREVGPRGPFFS